MQLTKRTRKLTRKETIVWWETRRITYNLIMAVAGSISLYNGHVATVFVYFLVALNLNILYTFGWIIELILIKPLKSEAVSIKYAKLVFWAYLIYSIIAILLFVEYPKLLDWTYELYRFN